MRKTPPFARHSKIMFDFQFPKETPENKKPIRFDRDEIRAMKCNVTMGEEGFRMVNAKVWRFATRYIREHGDAPMQFSADEFRRNCFTDGERLTMSPISIGMILNVSAAYDIGFVKRKRSGGRDPVTGRNKQTITGMDYRFTSAYDLKGMMELHMSIWYPWLAEQNGESGQWDNERFQNFLEWLEDEPQETLMTDLLAIKGKDGTEIEEEDRGFMLDRMPNAATWIPTTDAEKEWLQKYQPRSARKGDYSVRPPQLELDRFLRAGKTINGIKYDKFGYYL